MLKVYPNRCAGVVCRDCDEEVALVYSEILGYATAYCEKCNLLYCVGEVIG